MYHNFFIHSSVNGHPSFFQVLAIINSAAMNTGVHVAFWTVVFSGYMPSSGITSFFKEFPHYFRKRLYQLMFPPTIQESFLFSTTSKHLLFGDFFDNANSDHCKWQSYYSFDLHFSHNERCWASFHVFVVCQHVFFGEMSI